MRKQILYCDKCKQRYEKKDMVLVNYTISKCGDAPTKSQVDLCIGCYNGLKEFWDKFIISEPMTVQEEPEDNIEYKHGPTTQEEIKFIVTEYVNGVSVEDIAKKTQRRIIGIHKIISNIENKHGLLKMDNPYVKSILKVEESVDDDFEYKTGPINDTDRSIILYMMASGESVISVSKTVRRPPRGVSRVVNDFARKEKVELTIENLKKLNIHNPMEAEVEEKSILSVIADEEENVAIGSVKNLDVGGIWALHDAGWNIKDIANEVHQEESVVLAVLNNKSGRPT